MNKAVNFRYHSVGRLKLCKLLNALEKSSFTNTWSWGIAVTYFLAAWTAASHPAGVAIPTCNGPKKGATLLTAYLLAHLATTLLRVYPIAIGLRPPDFLESAMRLPPNNMGLTSTGQAPRSKMLINPVISFRSAEDVSRWLASSRRCWGHRPSGPPAEPDGKERSVRAWKTSETIGVGVNWVFTSQETEVLQVWCGRATLVTKNANSCTNISILQFGGDSSQEDVRAFTWGSVPSPRSYSLHRWLCGSTQGFHTSLHYICQIVSSAGSIGLS